MNIGIIGAGRIGGGIARQLAGARHEVMLSFSRNRSSLERLAAEIGPLASIGTPAEATAFGDVVVISVPWSVLPEVLDQAQSFGGKVVIDTTNQYGDPPLPAEGETAAHFNAGRMRDARYTKSFNTLTADFQAEAAGRTGDERVVQWLCGDDAEAKAVVAGLIEDAGFVPFDVGGTVDCWVMEAPRRPGAVYGEEYRAADAVAVLEAVRAGRPIPPTPVYERSSEDLDSVGRRFTHALGSGDHRLLDELYDPDVLLYTPLGWPIRGLAAVQEFVDQFHSAYPGLRVTLHDEFGSADGERVCFRFVIHFENTGPFYGHPPTGERGTMSETHAIRLREGRIVEQFVGDNNFSMPYQELAVWKMDFPRDTPDPNPATTEAGGQAQG
jgi:predicted dinucleotide-binding enzyme